MTKARHIDISEQLREQRNEYVKLRERAARISTQ
jgi:hypothetical protein